MNGTGPAGLGAGTGWGLGPCGGSMGYGRCAVGRGLGWRRFFSPKNELATLEDEERFLKEELAVVQEEKAALKDHQK